MLHELAVGKPYHQNRKNWPEAVQYNFRGGSHELVLFMDKPTPAEIQDVKTGEAEFALVVVKPAIFLLYRFGTIPWSDACYTWHLLARYEQVAPEPLSTVNTKALLTVILVDASTGIVEALRAVTFSSAFTASLHDAIVEQAASPKNLPAHDRAIALAYARYPTSADMVKAAIARCKGGEG